MTDQNNLPAQPAVVRATIHITRKATGKVETFEIVGTPLPEQPQETQQERRDGSDPPDRIP